MNYYAARQRKSDSLWHYTCMNDNQIWPVGYCGQGCPGHATRAEAEEHQKQYLLDNAKYRTGESSWPKYKCEVEGCEREATGLADIPGSFHQHRFCADHCNRVELSKLIEVGETTSSY